MAICQGNHRVPTDYHSAASPLQSFLPTIMSTIASAVQAAHSVATSLLARSQIQPGGTIPALEVKEDAADKTVPLKLTGKNIIVSRRSTGRFELCDACNRSASLALSRLHVTRIYLVILRTTTSSRPRASTRSTSLLSTTISSPSTFCVFSYFPRQLISPSQGRGRRNLPQRERVRHLL